jgi:hypothetical protein
MTYLCSDKPHHVYCSPENISINDTEEDRRDGECTMHRDV